MKIALGVAGALAELDEDTQVLYFDLVEAALGDAARKAFSMLPQNYQFQGPTFTKGKAEGLLEGKAEGLAASILEVLDARAISLSVNARSRIERATDLDQLRHWLRRAVVVTTMDELFED